MLSVLLPLVVSLLAAPVLASVLARKQNVVLEVQHVMVLHVVVVNQVKT